MKTYHALLLTFNVLGWLASAAAQETDPPAAKPKPPADQAPAGEVSAVPAKATKVENTNAATATATNGEKGLRLNFRGVPLEWVLDYLSDAAGFIIVAETEVKG